MGFIVYVASCTSWLELKPFCYWIWSLRWDDWLKITIYSFSLLIMLRRCHSALHIMYFCLFKANAGEAGSFGFSSIFQQQSSVIHYADPTLSISFDFRTLHNDWYGWLLIWPWLEMSGIIFLFKIHVRFRKWFLCINSGDWSIQGHGLVFWQMELGILGIPVFVHFINECIMWCKEVHFGQSFVLFLDGN